MAAKVLLFRDPNEYSDKFHNCFLAASTELNVVSISALEIEFCNKRHFWNFIENSSNYEGIIFTNSLTAVAFSFCIGGADPRSKRALLPIIKDNWKLFSLGQCFIGPLRQPGFTYHGENCTNMEELAQCISSFDDAGIDVGDDDVGIDVGYDQEMRKPYILPMGNIARETVQVGVVNGIPVHRFCVYNTKPAANFATDLDQYVKSNGLPNALVFFSPLGVQFHLDKVRQTLGDLGDVKVIAIGQTTATALEDAGCRCDGVSPHPTPESLVETVLSKLAKPPVSDETDPGPC